jgi:BASS family bile acid:Na+ symporter
MTDESLLVVALSVASTASAGLSAGVARATRTDPQQTIARGTLAAVVVANLVGLPLLAWAIASAFGTAGVTGIVVVAAAPGGPMGPLFAVLAGGDAPLAARLFLLLTAVGTVGGLGALAVIEPVGVATLATAVGVVVAFAVLPLVLGQLAGARWPTPSARGARWAARASLALLVATIVLLASRHGGATTLDDLVVSAIVVFASLAIGFFARTRAEALAVAEISGYRNLTLALLALAAMGGPPIATSAVLAYGAVMLVVTAAVAVVARATAGHGAMVSAATRPPKT